MHYVVENGGKRIRPLLVYAAGVGCQNQATLDTAALAIEYMHCYSLVHDDLPAMDDDDWRRGKPSCHKAFNEATAILVGDALQSFAFELLTSAPLPNQLKLIHTLAKASGLHGMVGGQSLDIEHTGKLDTLETIQKIHHLKTGCLLIAAIQMGGLIANVSDQTLHILTELGHEIGLAFQIRDDIRDVECDSTELGKTAGKDIAQSKATYPALLGLETAKIMLKTHLDKAETLIHQLKHPKQFLMIHQLLAN